MSQLKKHERRLFDNLANFRPKAYQVMGIKDIQKMGYITHILSQYIDEGKCYNFLEAGCGTGRYGKFLLDVFPKLKVKGLDISPKMVKLANVDAPLRFEAEIGDLENVHLFEEQTFDIIGCFGILHHFPSLFTVLENMSKWLKPDGYIVISEPSGNNFVNKFSKIILRILTVLLKNDFFIRHFVATPNETNHQFNTYTKNLLKTEYKIILYDFVYIRSNVKKRVLIEYIKDVLYNWTYRFTPFQYKGNEMIICAQKK